MTQPITQPAGDPPAIPPTPPTDPPADPPTPTDLGDPGKKALGEERAARKTAEKERAALEARLKEFEDRDKTEAQKLAERAAAAEKTAADKDAEVLRLRTALKHGIADEDAETFLTGTDQATLTKQAERLVALRGPVGPRTPAPDPSQGARGTGSAASLDDQITAAIAKGDWKAQMRLNAQKLAEIAARNN